MFNNALAGPESRPVSMRPKGCRISEVTRAIHKVTIASLALGICMSGWAQAPASAPPKAKAKQKHKIAKSAKARVTPAAQTQPVIPAPPVVPPRPYEMAPVPPQVTYQNGLLTIVATNSTLSAILSAVRTRTGAQVDVPADASNDRVAAQIGPGNPREVLSALLEGSRFDYIVLGSANDPNALSQVVLTPHRGGANTAAAGGGQTTPPPSGATGPPGAFIGGVTRPEINADEDEPEPAPAPEPAAVAPQPGVFQPGIQPGAPIPNVPPVPAQPGPQGQQNPGQVKTPEQLLQELQRMQQPNQQQYQRRPQD